MTDTQAPKPAPATIETQKVEQEVSWLGARLREPSTYAGLGTLATMAALFHVVPDAGSGADLVKDITMIGMGLGGLIAIVLPEKGSKKPAAPGPTVNNMAAFLLAIGIPLFLLFGAPAHAATKKPQLTGNVINDIRSAVSSPQNSASSGSAPTCDFNLFTALTPQNIVAQLQACGQKLAADSQAALASASKANDSIATACLTPAVALVQAAIGTPATPAIVAVPATSTSPAVAAVPAQAAQLPGPILIFQKFREFVDNGGITNCKAWVNNTVTASASSGL